MRLRDRVAVVTGAGSGIGRAISEVYAKEGAKVVALDLRADTAEETVAKLAGDGHAAYACDVADSASVHAAFDEAESAFGHIDIVVNNAGVDRAPGDGFDQLMKTGQQIIHMSDEGFTRLMAINVNGVFFCTREAAQRMQRDERGGAIINMSSIAGLSAQGGIHYCASKSAVLGMTRSAARELGPSGIRVNAICPGVIETPMTDQVPDFALKGLIANTPLRRTGQALDIANSALFLASDESSFISGQWISPNGGLIMC